MKLEQLKTKLIKEALGISSTYASDLKRRVKKMPIPHCLTLSKKYGLSLHDLRPDVYPTSERNQ